MVTAEHEHRGSGTDPSEKTTEERLTSLETRMGLIEAMLAKKKENEARSIEREEDVAALMDKVQTKDAIIICYRKNGPQTKEQVKAVLKTWGTPFGSWFDGGNFAARLVRKGILTPDGKDENGRTMFTLTVRGRKIADELIEKIRASTS